ncbi:flagellin N-terminal helical domain-containing protein [Aliamphritea ceti]|uniref:flagellin N-terminal helical domain-containing protein n=1 Tax=Aliamphritea ceti TaxID=1524258 RepID=UPI0021C35780|nr:flagellin [Aliamphritea ceti]
MALVINSNIQSLNAQRNLNSAQMEQNEARERLSSGKRINSAADDAAGLAISNRMTSQINGLNQAVRNANDGVSLIQTAEGALDESTNILQRMRELSIQSANGTYDSGNRGSMNAEVQQLVAELDRISETTSFNGQNILDGSQGKIALQVGSEANQTISFEIGKLDSKSLGLGSTSSDTAGTHLAQALTATTIDDGDVLINGQNIGAFDGSSKNFDELISQINTNVNGVTASGFNNVEATDVGNGVTTSAAALTISIGETNGGTSLYTLGATNNLEELVSEINTQTAGAVTASIDDSGKLNLSNSTGASITFGGAGGAAGITTATGLSAAEQTSLGQIGLTSDDGNDITVEAGVNGTSGDLANLGFQETRGDDTIRGGALNATALAYGELTINGSIIDHENTDSLQGKVDNINAATGDTNVVASLVAESSGEVDLAKTSTQLTGTADTSQAIAGTDDIIINGRTIAAGGTDIDAVITAINADATNTGVTASKSDDGTEIFLYSESSITLADGTNGAGNIQTAFGIANGTTAATAIADNDTIRLNDQEVVLTDADDLDQIVADINGAQATTGVHASVNDQGEIVLDSNAAFNVAAGDVNGEKVLNTLGLSAGANAPGLELKSLNGNPISIELSGSGAANTGLIEQNTSFGGNGSGSSISSVDISTAAGAQKAIGVIDNALTTINETRGELGAVNNRLDFTVSNLSNVSENAAAARSQILDADFAAESANLSRAQVLQQAGSAMLAQANAAPQQVLSLLQ